MERRIKLKYFYDLLQEQSDGTTKLLSNVPCSHYIKQEYGAHKIKVYMVGTDGTTETLIDISNIEITSFDDTVKIEKTSTEFHLIPVREGSAYLRAYYKKTGDDSIVEDDEIVVYNTFFQENYQKFFSEFDVNAIHKNKQLEALFFTCMEFFDILYAYVEESKYNSDPLKIKWKFLTLLGDSFGFDRFVFPNGSETTESLSERLYRELLSNLFDLLSIRGTPLAYELFFNAIGCDIDLLEFWYDDNGNLIEINPYDESKSTYAVYDVNGVQASSSVLTTDPRSKASAKYAYNKNNKSNFIKPIITPKTGLSYSINQQAVFKAYLEFLRPIHIKYLTEAIGLKLSSDSLFALMTDANNFLFTQIDNTNVNIVSGATVTIYERRGVLYDLSNKDERLAACRLAYGDAHMGEANGNPVATIHGYKFLYSDGTMSNSEVSGKELIAPPNPGDMDIVSGLRGTWTFETGGLYAEHIADIDDGTFFFNHPIELHDTFQTMLKYSSSLIAEMQGRYNKDIAEPILFSNSNVEAGYKYEIAVIDGTFDFRPYAQNISSLTGTGAIGDVFTRNSVALPSGYTSKNTVYQLDFKKRRVLNRENDQYTYATATKINNLKYDVGVFLSEEAPVIFNVSDIKIAIADYKAHNIDENLIQQKVIDLFNIKSVAQYNSILSCI